MTKSIKHKIFISYAHEDQPIALEIYNFLREKGFSPWIDINNLMPGQDWKLEIEKAIQSSDFFIACLSSNSISKRGYVQKELKSALSVLDLIPEGQIYLLPIRLDGCSVPQSLLSRQWLDWNITDSRKKLLEALGIKTEPTKTTAIESEAIENDWRLELSGNTKQYRGFRIYLSKSDHRIRMESHSGGRFLIWANSEVIYDSMFNGFMAGDHVLFQVKDGKVTRDVIIKYTVTGGMSYIKKVQVKVDGRLLYNEK